MSTRMKQARLARSLTQVQLAYHSGVAPGDISKAENGMAKLYPGQAERIARVLELTPSDLLLEAVEPVAIR